MSSDRGRGVAAAVADAERRHLEEELAEARRLSSIGRLAAGIAHEINTPTQFVNDNTRFLKDAFQKLITVLGAYERVARTSEDRERETAVAALDETLRKTRFSFLTEEIPAAIEDAVSGLERIASIVKAMKSFSHPGADDYGPVDLNEAVRVTTTVARSEWKHVAEMELELSPDLPMLRGLRQELCQVLLNLVVNAAHAIGDRRTGEDGMRDKGKITIRTRPAGDAVEVQVSDTGCGVPKDLVEKVFEPFFTTKEVGRGTGQGLALVRSIVVDKHGGSVELESEEGVGTTFTLTLPVDPPVGAEAAESSTGR